MDVGSAVSGDRSRTACRRSTPRRSDTIARPWPDVSLDDAWSTRRERDRRPRATGHRGRLHRTPLTVARAAHGARVYLKAELFQRTGSFKPRGVLNKLAHSPTRRSARGVIAISAGNHAQALAYASALEGIDALVVMWQGASAQKIAAARGYGATVDLEAPTALRTPSSGSTS